MTIKEINHNIEAYAKTLTMLKSGVDGVEVHAVHEGYVLDQFTLKYTNQRTMITVVHLKTATASGRGCQSH
jgi:2-enoate reductase